MKTWCEVDLETLGTRPGCVVLSVGACSFDADGLGETFYAVLNMQEQTALGAHSDSSTLLWWSRQSPEAREVLEAAKVQPPNGTRDELERFSAWWTAQGCKHFTANGSDFDGPILSETYRLLGLVPPWKFYNARCHRTMKELFRAQVPEPPREGVAHRADHDAAHQARHASLILRYLRDTQGLGGRIESSAKAPLPAYDPRAAWHTARNLGEDARLTQGFTPMNFDPVEGGAAQDHPTRIVELPVIAVPLVDEESLGDALARIRKETK